MTCCVGTQELAFLEKCNHVGKGKKYNKKIKKGT